MSYGQYSPDRRHSIPARPDLTKKQTPKREKHVFGSNDTGVEHVWANPLTKDGQGYYQTHGTNPRKNYYFKTDADATRVLYSYRDTYPIASLFDIGKGRSSKRVYLVRSGKAYSVTTSVHMNAARQAIPDKANMFEVPYVTRYDLSAMNESGHHCGQAYPRDGKPDKATHKANLADIIERLTQEITKLSRARSTWQIKYSHASAIELRNKAKQYARVFKLKLSKLPVVPAIDKEKYAKSEKRESESVARATALREQRQKEWEKKHAEDLVRWKQGDSVHLGYGYMGSGYALLRVVEETSNPSEPSRYVVQTSQNVTVPVSGRTGAARLWRFLKALKDAGRTYERNGHTEHIGQFAVDSFGPVSQTQSIAYPAFEWILVAGCHRIRWSEVESIAQQVTDAEALEAQQGLQGLQS